MSACFMLPEASLGMPEVCCLMNIFWRSTLHLGVVPPTGIHKDNLTFITGMSELNIAPGKIFRCAVTSRMCGLSAKLSQHNAHQSQKIFCLGHVALNHQATTPRTETKSQPTSAAANFPSIKYNLISLPHFWFFVLKEWRVTITSPKIELPKISQVPVQFQSFIALNMPKSNRWLKSNKCFKSNGCFKSNRCFKSNTLKSKT